MTVSERTQPTLLGEVRYILRALAVTFGPFVLAGCIAFLSVVGLRELSVPLADRMGDMWSPLLSVAGTPYWVQPVTLRPAAMIGLKPLPLAGAVGMWTVSVVAVTVASGLVFQSLDRDTQTLVPPVDRVFWLVAYAVGLAVALGALEPLLRGVTLPVVLGTLALVVVLARLFVTPVTIVRDGRGPFEAIRWSNDAVGAASATPAMVLGVVGFALAYRLMILFAGFLFSAETTVLVSLVLGTALVGTVHAGTMVWAYGKVESYASTDR
jgi:hypothetical protein